MLAPKIPQQVRDQIEEMIAADLPTDFIAHHLGVQPLHVARMRQTLDPRKPDKDAVLKRAQWARNRRVKAHIAAYPNRSLYPASTLWPRLT